MIRFPCRCGHLFEEPDDAAGSSLQCPSCMLLNDVPLASELLSMTGDGTYVVGGPLRAPNPDAVNDLVQAFHGNKVDADGNAVDRRTIGADLDEVGVYDTVAELKRRERPRYDPETGERVLPIGVAEPVVKPAIAKPVVTVKPIIDYATPTLSVFQQLLQAPNMLVMFFVVCIGVFGGLTIAVTIGRLIFFIPVLFGIALVLFSHYGNIVTEIGVEERDELPRVLGDMRLYEDVFLPAAAFFFALVVCYGPIAALFLTPLPLAVIAMLAIFLGPCATFIFPAVMLTVLSSGAISNLRPDRVRAVMYRERKRYLRMVVAFFFALVCGLWTLVCMVGESLSLVDMTLDLPGRLTSMVVGFPLMIVSIFLMHYFCWQLGLYYRDHHRAFPWVGRYHVGAPRPPVVRKKPRYVKPPSVEG